MRYSAESDTQHSVDDHAYVEGTTAAALIPHPRGQPDLPLVLDVLNQVAEALDYAHRMDVLHRDVKPTNVRSGRTAEISAVLTDFGISRFLDGTWPVSQNGRIAGSLPYAGRARSSRSSPGSAHRRSPA